ncbi:MAG: prepilin-type N-terminal cleavage/methylation domain-containing protein [Cyanobacteria bacterium]|nr:prepilin-type N-terminal cleavage/methylation domain-containing protein [Cyanobacteriota bacterium]MDW8201456.1 type IV pilin-like G/H family protein [Cyanobacteriota bacterium SKYGB_h_bin112]
MTDELKAILMRTRVQATAERGFTLIELLVVIVVIGILSALALPSFLNQASKAKQSEAKQNVGSLNRAQQAYYLENYEFGTTVHTLGIGIHEQTDNYSYAILLDTHNTAVEIVGASLKKPLRHYQGRVWLDYLPDSNEVVTQSNILESRQVAANHTGLHGLVTSSNFGLIRDLDAVQLQRNWRQLDSK